MRASAETSQLILTMTEDEAIQLRKAIRVVRNVLVTLKARAEMQKTSACFEQLDAALSVGAPSPKRTMDDHA